MRHNWSSGFEFIMCCLCYNISTHKFLYVPRLIFEYGGVNFFLVYGVVCLTMTVPLMHFQVGLAQFSSSGNRGILEVVPLLRGFAYAKMVLLWWTFLPHGARLTFSLLYFTYTFKSTMPWTTCNGTEAQGGEDCFVRSRSTLSCREAWPAAARRYRSDHLDSGIGIAVDDDVILVPADVFNTTSEACTPGKLSAPETFFKERSQSPSETPMWAAVAWIFVFAVARRGIVSTFQALCLFTIFAMAFAVTVAVRLAFLPGAFSNMFIFHVKWSEFSNMRLWTDVIESHLYDVGVTGMVLYRIASYNKYNNDFRRQIYVIISVDFLACLVAAWLPTGLHGYMHAAFGIPFTQKYTGPDLLFVVLPEVLSMWSLSRLWSALYFLFLFLSHVGVPVIFAEAILEVLVFECPWLRKWETALYAGLYTILFLAQSQFTTEGGWYLLQPVSHLANGGVIAELTILEMVFIVQMHGMRDFEIDFESMVGSPPSVLLRICWASLVPIVPTVMIAARHLFLNDAVAEMNHPVSSGSVFAIAGLLLSLSIIVVFSVTIASANNWDWKIITVSSSRWFPKDQKNADDYRRHLNAVLLQMAEQERSFTYMSRPDVSTQQEDRRVELSQEAHEDR